MSHEEVKKYDRRKSYRARKKIVRKILELPDHLYEDLEALWTEHKISKRMVIEWGLEAANKMLEGTKD